jgi:hypothetical protein
MASVEMPVIAANERPVLEAGLVISPDRPVSVVTPLRLGARGERQPRQQALRRLQDSSFAEP